MTDCSTTLAAKEGECDVHTDREEVLGQLAEPRVAQFVVQLSLETPVEKALAGILHRRRPVRVGRLRYVLGSELLGELIVRGAESLENEYQGTLGLAAYLHEDALEKAREEVHKPGQSSSPAGGIVGGPRAGRGDATLHPMPRLDVSGFDFGSSPVHPRA